MQRMNQNLVPAKMMMILANCQNQVGRSFFFVCFYFEARLFPLGKVSFGQKILNVFLFIWAFIESVMLSATNFFNRYTRDYRYVVKVLRKEKKILKVFVMFQWRPTVKMTFFCVCAGKNQLQCWSAHRLRENMAAGRFFPHTPPWVAVSSLLVCVFVLLY